MKKIVCVLMLVTLVGFDGTKLVKTKISNNISLLLPKDFAPMNEFDQQERIYSYRKALAVYTSPDRLVEFGVNRSFTQWAPKDIELMGEFYRSTIMSIYDDLDFMTEGIKTINGRQYSVFEFIGTVRDRDRTGMIRSGKVVKKYVYLQYTIYEKNSLVFNFTTSANMKSTWQPLARKIMQSVKIN